MEGRGNEGYEKSKVRGWRIQVPKDWFIVEFQWDIPQISNSVRLVSGKSVEVLKMYTWHSGICWVNGPLRRSKLSHKLKLEFCTIYCCCTTQSVIQLSCSVCVCVCVCVCARARSRCTYGCLSESNSASQYIVIFIEMLFTTFMFGTFL